MKRLIILFTFILFNGKSFGQYNNIDYDYLKKDYENCYNNFHSLKSENKIKPFVIDEKWILSVTGISPIIKLNYQLEKKTRISIGYRVIMMDVNSLFIYIQWSKML